MRKPFLIIIILFTLNPIYSSGNEELIRLNRKKAYSQKLIFSTSPNPFVFYKLSDKKGRTAIIVINTSYDSLPFINKTNRYDTNIEIGDIDLYIDDRNYIYVDEKKLKKSSYFGLTKEELKIKYFDKKGLISDYTFVDDIEFIYYILSLGIYIYHGCVASSELYIE